MVHISHETEEQTERRLRRVIADADFVVHPGSYVFEEFPRLEFPNRARADALALVRDEDVWSQLVPSNSANTGEEFLVFSFHFDGCDDNSGFVGWLANHLKRTLGTGVFVTCGRNEGRGGIFDYNGVPLEVGEAAVAEVRRLRGEGDPRTD